MDIISFDVCGKMAHFRKYYANNTAFSYSIPPRTTIIGMLAAIAGYDRDQYYEKMASKHLRIAIRVMGPVKKTFHRLNFLSIKSRGDALSGTGDFTGAGGRIQTPFEIITGLHLGKDIVRYRIFLAAGTENSDVFSFLKTVILERKQHFNLTLGTANFSAWLENISYFEDVPLSESDEFIKLHSAVPSDKIEQLNFQKDDPDDGYNYLEEELMPADFVANNNRELSKLIRVLFSTQGKAFSAKVTGPVYNVADNNGIHQNITFLE